MRQGQDSKSSLGKFLNTKPQAVSLSPEALVQAGPLRPGLDLPLAVQPAVDDLNLTEWAVSNPGFIEDRLLQHGGILFRNFNVGAESAYDCFVRSVTQELLDYHEPSSPRTEVGDKIYTSTEYPADERIELHNELSYSHVWPRKIFFFCLTPAEEGGETPIADSRRVFELLDPGLKKRFIEKGVMYVRNFYEELGLPWQRVFRTADRAVAERYFRRAGMKHEWKNGVGLRVSQVRPAAASHPKTGEVVWFNQAHLFHVSNMGPAAQESLRALYREEELPSNAYYGDGSPIEVSVLDEIREAYRLAATTFPWRRGDILMLDNMLVAHGRASFVGARRILVAMAEPASHGTPAGRAPGARELATGS